MQDTRFRRMAMVVGVVVMCALLAVGGWKWATTRSTPSQQAADLTQAQKTQKLEGDYSKASQDASQGNYDQGLKTLEDSALAQPSKTDQAFVYTQAAALALNAQKYDDALRMAQKSESAYPTATSAQLQGDSLRKLGKTSEAIAQYKVALSRMTAKGEAADADRAWIRESITELGGTP